MMTQSLKVSVIAASLILAVSAHADDAKPAAAKPANAMMMAKKDTKAVTVNVDTAASKVTWIGKKLAGEHKGAVGIKAGSFDVKNNAISKGEVTIDLASITNTDLTNDEYNKKLVGHLKSPDFFDVEKFPTATYKIESFTEVHNITPGEPNAEIKGKLTIKGVTKPLNAKLFFTPNDAGYSIKGKLMIERTQFGLKYNSKKFFDPKALGDKLIDDQFEVDLDLVAKK